MILAVLSAALKCDWNLDEVQMATITTVATLITLYSVITYTGYMQVVFFGVLIGNPVWGTLADKFGRKKVQQLILVLVNVFLHVCVYACAYTVYVNILREKEVYENRFNIKEHVFMCPLQGCAYSVVQLENFEDVNFQGFQSLWVNLKKYLQFFDRS